VYPLQRKQLPISTKGGSVMEATYNLALLFGYAMLFILSVAIVIGQHLFKRMLRLYHISSISYWLHHYEKRGRKCFLTPEEGEMK
jgi:hypothetical protein